jgi:hypothetical protein
VIVPNLECFGPAKGIVGMPPNRAFSRTPRKQAAG